MPGWNDLTRNIQERIFLLVAHETVGFSFPEPPTEDRISALHAVQLSRSNYNPAVKALWQHLWITETDLGDPKHGRTLDLLLRTIDSCDPAIQADGALPPATYVESISYTTSWKTASVSRAQRDLAHLIRLCPNLKRLRLDGVFFHLPSFFTTLTQNTSLHELRLENLASHICAEDINTVLASQPQLKSFRLISDLFEDAYVVQRRSSEPLVKQPCPELVSITLSTMPIQSITTLLGGCELPALKQADICLPAISDSGARPYELDFLDVLPNTLAELKLTEDGRCYDASSIDWHKVAEAFPQLKQLRSNLSTTVFCGPKAPFAELVNLTLVYPRPSPLSFLRCLKDEAWMPNLSSLNLECWSGSPSAEHINLDGVNYIKEKGEVPGVLHLHQIDMLDEQAAAFGANRKNKVKVQIGSS